LDGLTACRADAVLKGQFMLKKRLLLFIVSFGLLTAMGFSTSAIAAAQDQTSEVVFKTPEDAITAYMQGIAQNDVSKILQACAIDEMSEHFSLDLNTARLGVIEPSQMLAPPNNSFYVAMNKAQLSAQILGQVKMFTFSLLSTEDMTKVGVIPIDAARTTQFIKDVDPSRLTQIEIKKIAVPYPTIMKNDKYLANASALAQIYGADEYTQRIVLFQFGGDNYIAGFSLLRYGESWKIMNAGSTIANIVSSGVTGKITEADFDKMTQ